MAVDPTNPVPLEQGKSNEDEYRPWRSGDPPDYVLTMPKSEGNPLDQLYKRMQKHDKESCERWRDEIEHLLIFAGLFSATVTAFLVDSYKWLRVDNSTVSTQLLAQISLQLGAIANNATFVPPAALSSSFTADPRSVRVNILWFLSLIMCLSTVIFGILCLQWLREYTRDMSFSPADAITIRQMRYDGLLRWKVPDVIAWLPIMLQNSVLLFFVGILDLLWSLHQVVAAIITAVVGLVALGMLFTTIAPVIQTIRYFHHFNKRPDPNTYVAPCPYRSPVSWVFLSLIMYIDPVFVWQRHKRTSWAEFDIFFHEKSKQDIQGATTYNAKGLARALAWVMNRLSPELNEDIPRDVYHSLSSGIDKSTSGTVLLDWAQITGETKKVAATLEDARRSGMYQAQYDLLLERLLRKCSPVQENRELLLELQVRCLNTFGDKEEMVEMYAEAASNCHYYCKEARDPFRLEENGLLLQTLMILLKSHHRLRREPFTDNHIGSILAPLFRNTQVTEDNANLCYQILHQFKLLLDGIYQASDSYDTLWNTESHSAVMLVHKLDLFAVGKWEMAIQKFTGNEIAVVNALTSLLEKLMPMCGHRREADEMKSQLKAFRDNRPHTYVYAF